MHHSSGRAKRAGQGPNQVALIYRRGWCAGRKAGRWSAGWCAPPPFPCTEPRTPQTDKPRGRNGTSLHFLLTGPGLARAGLLLLMMTSSLSLSGAERAARAGRALAVCDRLQPALRREQKGINTQIINTYLHSE